MFGMGMGELVVVFLIILMLFGAKKLPEMAQAMGKSVREFRKAASELRDSVDVVASQPVQAIEQKTEQKVTG